MVKERKKIRVGVTVGDLNGIGMEVIIKTFEDKRMMDFCTPIIFSSSKTSSYHRKVLEIKNFSFNIINNFNKVNDKQANLINCWEEDIEISLGKMSPEIGKYAFLSLEKAKDALKNNDIDVLVTSPINKSAIQQNQKNFIGHTEYLEENFEGDSLMMMISENMKIAFVTSHIPLSEVSGMLNEEKIVEILSSLNNTLLQDFGIRKPKIAVIGLNPHAGEDGMLGKEENEIIIPSIVKSKNQNNVLAFGPYPADSFFTSSNLKKFDAILSMYHDQGLTPFKTLSFSEGVNYTSGLNIVRTSPVHGTAFDIAGKNIADPQSFRESVFLACKIIKKRREYFNLKNNSLKVEKSEH
jgi:4-hydroxythreonine-4-phosphate dehydrogenase